jgi:hypothetical protein
MSLFTLIVIVVVGALVFLVAFVRAGTHDDKPDQDDR